MYLCDTIIVNYFQLTNKILYIKISNNRIENLPMNFKGIHDQEWTAKVRTYLSQAATHYLPGVSVNIVVFNYCDGKLNVLLMRFADTQKFMLPGGYVLKEEDLDDAALRCFRDWTGMGDRPLDQFYTSGKADRSMEQLLQGFIGSENTGEENWLEARKISVCYYAITEKAAIKPSGVDLFISEFQWTDTTAIPELIFDHHLIIDKAILRLQDDLDRKIVELDLLHEPFTMAELQRLYEVIFQRSLTRTNFQRRMLNLGILERVGKHYQGKAHKAPYLYRVKK